MTEKPASEAAFDRSFYEWYRPICLFAWRITQSCAAARLHTILIAIAYDLIDELPVTDRQAHYRSAILNYSNYSKSDAIYE